MNWWNKESGSKRDYPEKIHTHGVCPSQSPHGINQTTPSTRGYNVKQCNDYTLANLELQFSRKTEETNSRALKTQFLKYPPPSSSFTFSTFFINLQMFRNKIHKSQSLF